MSQESLLRSLDGGLMTALVDAGLADAAVFRALADPYTEIACDVVVDHTGELAGEAPTAVVGARTVIRLQTLQIPSPARGDTLTVGATVYTLLEPVGREPGVCETWSVRRG